MHSPIALALISLVPALTAFPTQSLYTEMAPEALGQNACFVPGGCGGSLSYRFPMQPPGRMVQPAPVGFQPNPVNIFPPPVRVTSQVRATGPPQAFSMGQGSLQEGGVATLQVLGQGVATHYPNVDFTPLQQPQMITEGMGASPLLQGQELAGSQYQTDQNEALTKGQEQDACAQDLVQSGEITAPQACPSSQMVQPITSTLTSC
ncbi:MAG: hypothetical protein DHS80DRAFT_25554 [Piptocephalis tieghemiana]|nr:MAG: hypothetical protein DHS80DRAFT_26206 [Piptocephalis tieghemiana]KAI9226078.1 MAG: hypothetical protein DHS80DRAFT_25554 [Piptocephalis tieghemiana]